MIRIIAKRYARALVELSEEKKTVDKTKADLAAFVDAVDALPACLLYTSDAADE